MDILSSLYLPIEDLVETLRMNWPDNAASSHNPLAFSKRKVCESNIMFCCPMHEESTPSCSLKTSPPYVWYCFGCEASGNVTQLVAYVLGLRGEVQALQFLLREYAVTEVDKRPSLDMDALLEQRKQEHVITEEEVRKYTEQAHHYMRGRGLSEHTLKRYEIGFDSERREVVFPVRTSAGRVRFLARRSVDSKRFHNASGVYKKDLVYGLYYILQSGRGFDEIWLTESAIDTLSCYQARLPAGAVLGRTLFKEQVQELMRAGIKHVHLFFDNDTAGKEGALEAHNLITSMSPIRVSRVVYPNTAVKDANDLLRAGLLRGIPSAPFSI